MGSLNTVTIEQKEGLKAENLRLCWKDSPAVQGLLDVISAILAVEYVQVAKQNPETFKSPEMQR